MVGFEPIDQSPDTTFDLLADETRLAIVRELGDAEGPISFAELRKRVGVRDSGRFNYHLDKLTERFVSKGEDGYALTRAGRQIDGTLQAGTYTLAADIEPIALDEPCPACESTQYLQYEDQLVRTECDCPVGAQFHVPPSGLAGESRERFPAACDRYLKTALYKSRRGFCTYCDGSVESSIEPLASPEKSPEDLPFAFDRPQEVPVVEMTCRRCERALVSGLSLALLDHPTVVSFYRDRNRTARDRPFWAIRGFGTDRERIRERDPLRAAVTYRVGDDAMTLVVDETLTVLETTRER